jgi:sugar phosphate isomerase/epimerase
MTLTRREFGSLALAGLVAPRLAEAAIDSTIASVRLGAQSYSFRELPRGGADAVGSIIGAMTECGLGDCELWSPQIEPVPTAGRGAPPAEQQRAREALRQWRLETPLTHFAAIKRRFDAAGITVSAFNLSFNESFTDAEIDRGFLMTKALGAEAITASSTLKAAARVAPFAEKHAMAVAMHNHSNTTDPNEFATPASFAAAAKISRYFKANLDIGHFTAANFDPVAYIREHHAQITNLHLKDRKRSQGDNTPWGQGDTPIVAVLQLLKKERWPIRAHIEYEYRGTRGPVAEVKDCYAFAKRALA